MFCLKLNIKFSIIAFALFYISNFYFYNILSTQLFNRAEIICLNYVLCTYIYSSTFQNTPSPGKPYHILFKGHPLSGKSVIASHFQALGVPVLCCNEILLAILNKDSELRENVMNKFSTDLNSEEGSIDFNKFTGLCLKNKVIC